MWKALFSRHNLDLLREDPARLFYYIKGHILWSIHKRAIYRFVERSVTCKECFQNNECKHCGCEFGPIVLSKYKCDKHVDKKHN